MGLQGQLHGDGSLSVLRVQCQNQRWVATNNQTANHGPQRQLKVKFFTPEKVPNIATVTTVSRQKQRWPLTSDHPSADVMEARECYLYPATAELQLYSNDTNNVEGLFRGDTQCADPEICSISAGARCENKIMGEWSIIRRWSFILLGP